MAPVQDFETLNFAANATDINVINGLEISQVDMTVPAVSISLWAVASAAGLTHRLVVGSRTPLRTSPVSVSATPTQIIRDQDGVISGVQGYRGETLRLFVSETAGVATTDYRGRLALAEL